MSVLSVIRAGIIGTASVVLPAIPYGLAAATTRTGVTEPFLVLFGATLALVSALAWTCVRFGRFSNRLTIFLTTFSFLAFTIFCLVEMIRGSSSEAANNPAAFVIQAVALALAVGAARFGIHLTKW